MVIQNVVKDGYFKGMNLNLTDMEALTIIQALRLMAENEEVHYLDRNCAKNMYAEMAERKRGV